MANDSTVFVVDDDPAMLDSMRWLIESTDYRVATYSSPQEFLDTYDPATPGCLVLDVRMPEMSGLDLQDNLLEKGVRVPIIFVTAHGDVPTSVRALKKGAVDFIEKPFSDQVLLDRIRQAVARDAEWRRDAARVETVRKRLDLLTPREREVMHGVVEGKANKVIARDLGVSTKTVEAHRSRVMVKMEAASIADLVKMAVLAGGQEAGQD